jgi:CHAT domain-containing protein/tetratricopeptide (TPR) repeat protein
MSDGNDQYAAMRALVGLQQETGHALFALMAGSERPSDAAYERYLDLGRRLLADNIAYERAWPGSVDIQTVAMPLVQQLLIYADHRQAAGDRDGAQILRDEAGALTTHHLDAVATAGVSRDRAMAAAADGRFHDALDGLDRVHEVFVSAGDTLAAAQTLIQLANVYEWLGDYERALEVLRAAHLEVAPALEHGPPSTLDVLMAMGRQFRDIASSGTNTREGEDALALRRIAFEVLQAEGRINRLLGNYDEADRLFKEARPLLPSFRAPTAALDYHLAAMAHDQGDLGTAERLIASIAPDFDRQPIRPRRAALRQVQADVLLSRGRPEQALASAEDGLRDQQTYPDLDLEWKLQWRRARALRAMHRPQDAISAYAAGVGAADRLRFAPLGYRLDTVFLRDKLPMIEDAIDLAVGTDDGPAAVWFIELAKSRALSATLSVPRHPEAARSPDEERFDTISARIDALAFALYSGSQESTILQQRVELLTERDVLLERIRIRDPRWRTMTEPPQVDVAALINGSAHTDRAMLVLYHRPGQAVAAVIDRDGIAVSRVDLTADVQQTLREYLANLRKRRHNPFVVDLSGEGLVGLEDIVSPGIAKRVAKASSLLIIPHGILHLLPWATMTVGQERLFERQAVGVLPNLASLPLIDVDPVSDPGVAIIGDPDYTGSAPEYEPLFHSGPEITEVAAVYGSRVIASPRIRDTATETAFWELANLVDAPSSILHFSGHGSLEAEEPLASGLILTGSTVDAGELVTRRCPFPEVVLSACSTGWRPQATRGLELAGDDALGLSASFLEAGAHFLLVSIPPIEEKIARTFTVAWHRHRRAGLTPLHAYRAVQQELYADAPDGVYWWAGITAYGCR